MSIRVFGGQWLVSGGQVATQDNCCCGDEPPQCEDDDDCGGGEYCCGGACQETPCSTACDDVPTGIPSCPTVVDCVPNGTGAPCTPGGREQPTTGTLSCLNGEPTQVTVTVTGYDASTAYGYDPALVSFLNNSINTSYVVDIDPCNAEGDATYQDSFDGDIYLITITYRPITGLVGINVGRAGLPVLASGARSENNGGLSEFTACGYLVFDCPMVSGAANGNNIGGDWSNAQFSVS